MSYVGWLRAIETFGTHWRDLNIVEPANGPEVGLPPGIGIVGAKLLQQTKSSQHTQVDVVMAYTCASGLSLGWWLDQLKMGLPPEATHPDAFVIATTSGVAWTSHYYRHIYMYPALAACRASGDAFLQTIDNTPGNTIFQLAFGALIPSADQAAVKSPRNVPGLSALLPTPRSLNTADGASLADPWTCLSSIWNGLLKTAHASLSCACNLGNGQGGAEAEPRRRSKNGYTRKWKEENWLT
jgi:hypothetical protein